MISSEVQRTLVKSPPELWSELSDEAALARHFGELGDIKITKLEPEQSVEWEAEAAKGKVELKPSGWGTKVTLTMEREVLHAKVDAEAEVEAEAEIDADAEVEVDADAEVEVDADAEVEVDADAEVEVDADAEVEVDADAEIDASRDVELDVERPTASGSEAPGDEACDARNGVSGTLKDEACDARNGVSGTSDDEPPAVSPRPGFFARLFKRRKKVEPASTAAREQRLEDTDDGAAADTSAMTKAALEMTPEADASHRAETSATADSERDGAERKGTTNLAEPERDVEAKADVEGDPKMGVKAKPESDVKAIADVEANADVEPTPKAEAESKPSADSPDLATELAAAEEAIAAQTTEMLTTILDRLGAAHHRPFSRA